MSESSETALDGQPNTDSRHSRHVPQHRGYDDERKLSAYLHPGLAAWMFIIVIALATIPAILCMPAGGGADGATQIARVDQISRGVVAPVRIGCRHHSRQPHDQIYGGKVDDALWEQANSAIIVSQLQSFPFNFPTFKDPHANFHGRYGKRATIHAFTNTAVYSPIVYAPQVMGLQIARHLTSSPYILIMAMSLSGVIAYMLIGWLAISLLPWGKWIMAVSLLVPAGVMTICNVSADTMTIAAVALLFSLSLRATLLGRLSHAGWLLFGISGILVAGVKTTYAPALALLMLPLFSKSMRHRTSIVKMCVSVVMSATVLFSWYLQVSSINTGVTDGPGSQPGLQKDFILNSPWHSLANLFKEGFANKNFFATGLPNWGSRTIFRPQTLVILAFIAAVACECQYSRHKFRGVNFTAVGTVLLLIGIMSIVLMELAEWLHFTRIGVMSINGVQERYFIPDQPFFMFPLAFLLSMQTVDVSSRFPKRINPHEMTAGVLVGLPAVATSWIVCLSFYFPQTV